MCAIVGADGVACKRERGRSPKEYESEKKTCTGARSGALFPCRKGATPTTGDEMNAATIEKFEDANIARMMRELQSDLADLVESGDMTAEEANEWANMKADQWAQGLS